MQGAISTTSTAIRRFTLNLGAPSLTQLRRRPSTSTARKYIFVLFWNEQPDLLHAGGLASLRPTGVDLPVAQLGYQPAVGSQCRHPVPHRAVARLAVDAHRNADAAEVRPVPRHVVRPREVGRDRPAYEHLPPEPKARPRPGGKRLFQSGAIQGTYDIEPLGTADAALKWTFDRSRATLSVRCSDLFDSGMPSTKVRYRGQWIDMGSQRYTHRDRPFLLPLRRLQGQKAQGGRHLTLRTLTVLSSNDRQASTGVYPAPLIPPAR